MKEPTFRTVLQEDDCSPDALETFRREFEKLVGCSLHEFKKLARKDVWEDEACIVYRAYPWKLSVCADDPYYLLEKAE